MKVGSVKRKFGLGDSSKCGESKVAQIFGLFEVNLSF